MTDGASPPTVSSPPSMAILLTPVGTPGESKSCGLRFPGPMLEVISDEPVTVRSPGMFEAATSMHLMGGYPGPAGQVKVSAGRLTQAGPGFPELSFRKRTSGDHRLRTPECASLRAVPDGIAGADAAKPDKYPRPSAPGHPILERCVHGYRLEVGVRCCPRRGRPCRRTCLVQSCPAPDQRPNSGDRGGDERPGGGPAAALRSSNAEMRVSPEPGLNVSGCAARNPRVRFLLQFHRPQTWALNSAVECHLHTVEVIGSNPIAPTNLVSGFILETTEHHERRSVILAIIESTH